MNPELSTLPELKFTPSCRKYRAQIPPNSPPDWCHAAHGYFRELTGEISCVLSSQTADGFCEMGVLMSPSRVESPDAPDRPAILVLAFLPGPDRLFPGHSGLLPNGRCIPSKCLPDLHKWAICTAQNVLFALDHPEESALALSMISSQPHG